MDQRQITALCGMEESLCRLVGLYGTRQPSDKDVADWFSGVEFEALRPEVSCMAAAVSADCDYAGVPQALIPRLKGISRYVHALNSGMTAGLCALGKRFNEANIPVLLPGSTAVHLGYPEPPRRHIWQTQISVPEGDFSQAVELAERAGFFIALTPFSADARRGNTQRILIRRDAKPAQEAAARTVGGVSFLLPGSGELLVSLSEAVFWVLSGAAPGAKLIPWIMDLHCVIGAAPDWKGAAVAAAERRTASQVRLILELYNSLIPNALTGEILDLFGAAEHTAQLAQLLLKYRKIRPGSARLKRLWLSTRIRNVDSSSAVPGIFFRELCRAAARKLTPES